jgi:hypothetical protein
VAIFKNGSSEPFWTNRGIFKWKERPLLARSGHVSGALFSNTSWRPIFEFTPHARGSMPPRPQLDYTSNQKLGVDQSRNHRTICKSNERPLARHASMRFETFLTDQENTNALSSGAN